MELRGIPLVCPGQGTKVAILKAFKERGRWISLWKKGEKKELEPGNGSETHKTEGTVQLRTLKKNARHRAKRAKFLTRTMIINKTHFILERQKKSA